MELLETFNSITVQAPLTAPEWSSEGNVWRTIYDNRLQHVLSRMNHHIHPLNIDTGERVPLASCCRKGRIKECKSGFPLESEMLDETILVCSCLAEEYGWTKTGARSVVGGLMQRRNDPWLNAGPSAWCIFSGDNGDIKFPHKIPIVPETHEKMLLQQVHYICCMT